MRCVTAFAASFAFAGAAAAAAPPCWSPAPGMTMCADGFMAMGGLWMRAPPFAAGPAQAGPTRWSQRWRVDPDGTRHETWESETTMPDGRVVRDAMVRTIWPDGRVCVRRGADAGCD